MRCTTCATQKLITKYQNLFFKISWAKKAVKFKFLHIKGFEIGIFLIFPNFCPQNLQKRFSYFLFMLRQLVIFAFVRWYFYVLEFLWYRRRTKAPQALQFKGGKFKWEKPKKTPPWSIVLYLVFVTAQRNHLGIGGTGSIMNVMILLRHKQERAISKNLKIYFSLQN